MRQHRLNAFFLFLLRLFCVCVLIGEDRLNNKKKKKQTYCKANSDEGRDGVGWFSVGFASGHRFHSAPYIQLFIKQM